MNSIIVWDEAFWQEQREFNRARADLNKENPFLDPFSEHYDDEATQIVLDMYRDQMKSGNFTNVKALYRAVDMFLLSKSGICPYCRNGMLYDEIFNPFGTTYLPDFDNNTGTSDHIRKQGRVHVCPDQVEQVSHILNKDDKARERDS